MQRLVMMFAVLLAVATGCLLWQDREPGRAVVPEDPSSDAGQTPAAVVLEGRARKDGAVSPATANRATHGAASAATHEPDADKTIAVTTLLVHVTLQGRPAPAGVFVRLMRQNDPAPCIGPLKTDERGIARFEGLVRGDYTIQARHNGYRVKTDWWMNEEEAAEARAEIDLEPGLPFDGRVIDALTEAPIEGASVIYNDWDETYEVGPTDARGTFHVPGMKDANESEILARAPGYVAKLIDLIADSGRIHPAVPVLRLERGGALLGTVLSPEGEPVAGARVRVSPQDDAPTDPQTLEERICDWQYGLWGIDKADGENVLSAVTGPDGTFRTEGLDFETIYDVFARAKGYGASAVTGDIRVTAVRSKDSVRLRLRRPGRVLLTVVLPEESRLASSTGIRLIGKWDARKPEKSKWKWQHLREPGWRSRKSYRFESVNPGPAHVYVQAEGYRPTATPVQVAEGSTVEVEVQLERGGVVAGIVVDPEGRPVPGATVCAGAVSLNKRRRGKGRFVAGSRSTETDPRGRFELGGLPSGEMIVVARAGDGALWTVEDTRCVPPARGLRLQLVRSGGVRVRLLKPSGEPFTGRVMTWIMKHRDGGSGRETKPEDGVVSSWQLADGKYELSLRALGYAWIVREFQIHDGKTLDLGDLVLDEGVTLSGRVVDDLGSPIPGATIDTLSNDERRTVTDSNGRFSLDHFPNGGFSIAVDAERHTDAQVEVQPSATTGLRIVLRRCVHVLARVRSAEGSARRDVTIEFRRPGAKATTFEKEVPNGETRTIEYYEDSEWGWADESGLLDEWIVAGTYIGYWKDEAGRWHEVGRWTFEAAKEYELTIVLPAR